jgi:hypothetical protein
MLGGEVYMQPGVRVDDLCNIAATFFARVEATSDVA